MTALTATVEERKEAFGKELLALLEKYQLGIIGTDDNEGTLGEITVFGLESPIATASWADWEEESGRKYQEDLTRCRIEATH